MMMKRIYYTLSIVLTFIVSACSEESITPAEEAGRPPFELPRGEEGSVEAKIYSIFERYGSYVLYDFDQAEFNLNWSSKTPVWYAPVKPGNEKYVDQVVTFLQENVFNQYADAFINKYLSFKIYLVDSLSKKKTYASRYDLVDFLERDNHGFAISHVGKDMDNFKEANWTKLKNGMISSIMNNVYKSLTVMPTEFLSLVERPFVEPSVPDPEGEFEDGIYSYYMKGFVKAEVSPYGIFMPPKEQQDLGDYLSFLMSTPKSKMDHLFSRFSLVKTRAFLLADFMLKEMDMDPIALQNTFCPDDALPVGYFDRED